MPTKRQKLLTLVALVSVGICIFVLTALRWPRTARNRVASPDEQVWTDHNAPPASFANGEAKAALSSGQVPHAISTEQDGTLATGPVFTQSGQALSEVELPSNVARHDVMAVRVALEKSNRPDLVDKPSGPERIRAHHQTLQIPDDALANLSTEELVDEITSSTLFVMMIAFPDADGGLDRYARSFNGVTEFLSRPDAAEAVLNAYRTRSKHVSDVEEDPMFVACFTIMEVLLSSQQVRNQVGDAKKQLQVVASIVESLDARAHYDSMQPEPVYGEATLEYSALAIARYLEALDDPDYRKWYTAKRETGLFVERLASYQEAKEIVSIGRKCLKNQARTQEGPAQ